MLPLLPQTSAEQRRAVALQILGALLVAVFCLWMAASLLSPGFYLLGSERVWFPAMSQRGGMPWPRLGLDFMYNFAAAHTWADQGNPYQALSFTFAENRYVYPPLVLRLFSWAALFPTSLRGACSAVAVWMVLLTALALVAAFAARSARLRLGLRPLPVGLLLGAFLLSTPFLFSLERGNFDMLVLACVVGSAAALRHRSLPGDLLAGLLLGLATWAKLYPGLIFLGLLGLRRWRAALAMAAAALAVGALDAASLRDWLSAISAEYGRGAGWAFANHAHSMTRNWATLAGAVHLPPPGSLAATALTLGLLLVPLTWVGRALFASPRRESLALPYLLWVGAAATFVPAVSFDYNLVLLVLALLATWDPSLPKALQVVYALQLVWLQPLRIPGLEGSLTFPLKAAGLLAAGAALAYLARAPSEAADCLPEPGLQRSE